MEIQSASILVNKHQARKMLVSHEVRKLILKYKLASIYFTLSIHFVGGVTLRVVLSILKIPSARYSGMPTAKNLLLNEICMLQIR